MSDFLVAVDIVKNGSRCGASEEREGRKGKSCLAEEEDVSTLFASPRAPVSPRSTPEHFCSFGRILRAHREWTSDPCDRGSASLSRAHSLHKAFDSSPYATGKSERTRKADWRTSRLHLRVGRSRTSRPVLLRSCPRHSHCPNPIFSPHRSSRYLRSCCAATFRSGIRNVAPVAPG